MSSRWWTIGVTACLAGSAVFWGLKLAVRPAAVPAGAQVAQASVTPRGDLSRLLGQEAAPAAANDEPPADARFQLLGVLAPRSGEAGGIALIAVDGKPPRAVRVGQTVDGAQVLKQVTARGAQLGPADGPATVMLSAPGLAAAATGTLPLAASGDAAAVTAVGAPRPGAPRGAAAPNGGQVVLQGATQPVLQPARSPSEPPVPSVQRPRSMVPPQVAGQQVMVAPQSPPPPPSNTPLPMASQ